MAMITGHTPLTTGKTGRQTEAWGHCHILDLGAGGGEAGTVTFLTVYVWRGADRGGERRKENK